MTFPCCARGYTSTMNNLNANQFDGEGLPGIDEDYPPEHSWAVEDPALVNGGSETPDDLRTRVSRENPDIAPADTTEPAPPLAGTDGVDDEPQLVADTGMADPDAGSTAEEAAMRIVEQ